MSARYRLKRFLSLYMPRLYERLRSALNGYRGWQNDRRIAKIWRNVARINRIFLEHHSPVVTGGPFAGMAYVPRAFMSAFVPKLLGSYEAELHGVLADVLAGGYDRVINIGCAEGYYAVGLAREIPKITVNAYDVDPLARQLCEEMAHLNGVDGRVLVEEACDIQTLNQLQLEGGLIICDCEGCELEVLRPDLVPNLQYCDILLELHKKVDQNILQTMWKRFSSTHYITVIDRTERDLSNYPELDFLKPTDRELAVSEFRPLDQQWVFMKHRVLGDYASRNLP